MKTERMNKSETATTGKKKTMVANIVPKVVRESLGSVSSKQWLDIGLFAGGLYCIYKFGGSLSNQIDQIMPNEEQMQ